MSLRHRTSAAVSACLIAVLCFPFSFSFFVSAQVRKDSSADAEKKPDSLAKARAQFARGELQNAEASLWTVLATDPNQEQALTLLATIRGRQQRYPEAEALFRRVLQINANSAPAHRGLGSTLIAEGQPDRAIEQYKAALDLAPGDLELKVEIAHLYAGRGQFQPALATLQTIPQNRLPVEAIPVEVASLLALGKIADVAPLAERAKNSPSAELELAEVFLDAKLPDQALQCLALAAENLKRRPGRFYYLQGRALQAKGQPEAALSALKQALVADPDSPDTLVAIAELYSAQNRHLDAVTALQKALTLSPENVVVLRHLVVEATKAGKGQVALDAASALSAKNPANPDDLYLAGAAMLQQNSAAASTVLEKYVALRTDNAKAWLGLGMAYVQQKRYSDAREPLERSLQLDPTLAEAEYQLGVVAKNESSSTEAIQYFQQAVKLQPQHAKALWSLGNLYLLSGDLKNAQETLLAAEIIDPNNLETEYDLGLVFSKLGKPEMAKDHFDRYHKLKDGQAPSARDAH
jgi:tetratricopeptide (TPR) repeat protein